MKTAHTPGKWIVRKLTHCLAVFVEHSPSDRIMVCQVAETATKADEPDRAPFDAALIASAPELLEACRMIVYDYEPDAQHKSGVVSQAMIEHAKRVIAKAGGDKEIPLLGVKTAAQCEAEGWQ